MNLKVQDFSESKGWKFSYKAMKSKHEIKILYEKSF